VIRIADDLDGLRRIIRNVDEFVWHDGLHVGWYPVTDEEPYGDDYFKKFEEYRETDMGKMINTLRVEFVDSFYGGNLVDIGIGCGYFIDQRGYENTKGYDISRYGVEWLNKNQLFHDPYAEHVDAITCWDSLEHIRDCWRLIECVRQWVFVSIPLFKDSVHARESKHFKPHEHWWYFTNGGLVKCFRWMGFVLVGASNFEVDCGREDIRTFAFKRV